MKDRSHDDAMAELFKEDPAFAVDLVNSLLDDVDQDGLDIAFRQMDKSGLFERSGVLYEVACDVLGAIIAHYSESIAFERDKPFPDLALVDRMQDAKRCVCLERDNLHPSDSASIKAVILNHGLRACSFLLDSR
jgi:hypothetical protein